MITIYFGYEKAKVVQALRYHFISRREIRLMIILVNVFAVLAFILMLTRLIQPMAFLLSSFLWAVLMASFWIVLPTVTYRRNRTFKDEFMMDFTEEYFTFRHEHGGRKWEWKALANYLETPHFFHFYFDSRTFLLVPKEAFKDFDETADVRAILKRHVKKG